MLTVKALSEYIDDEIGKMQFPKSPEGLYEPITYSLSLGGKRMRPLVCLAACSLFNDNYQRAMPAALALEMFHNFTLLHDDVMDNAALRRNKPTVHAKFGRNAAILSGDQMLIEAYKLLAQSDTPLFSIIMDSFSQMATEVCEGQQYDIDFESRNNVGIEEYLEMIRLKTSVLIATSIKIGALIGGGTGAEVEALYRFGIDLGLSFQLQDDLLDTYGNEATFGKAIGGDIMENKKTFLLITALKNANTVQKKELMKWIEAEAPERQKKIDAVREIYDAVGVRAATEAEIEKHYNNGIEILRQMDISAEGKRFFVDFGDNMLKRNR